MCEWSSSRCVSDSSRHISSRAQYAARRLVVVKDEALKGTVALTGHCHASPSHDGAAHTRGTTSGFRVGCFSQCARRNRLASRSPRRYRPCLASRSPRRNRRGRVRCRWRERVGVRVAGGRFRARNPKPCSPLWGFCFSSETLTTQNMQHVVAELPSHTDVSPDSYRIEATRNNGAKR